MAFVGREQCTRARVVPWNFWNIRSRGAERGSIARVPIRRIRPGERVAEVRASHRHVVRRGRECVHRDAMRRFGHAVVATRRPAVARSHENGDAFRRRLLIRRVVRRVGRRAIHRFALAVADAHDGRRTARVDQVLHRNQAAERRARVGARRHHDGRVGSRRAGPFRIQDRFRIVRRDNPGIEAIAAGMHL